MPNASTNPLNQGPTPKPVTLSNPPFLTAADYQQLIGLFFADKVVQMRGILTAVAASRTPADRAKYGDFLWVEGVGPGLEVLFIGQGGPAAMNYPTVTIIARNGEVYRMKHGGITNSDLTKIPKEYTYDLVLGNAQLMVS